MKGLWMVALAASVVLGACAQQENIQPAEKIFPAAEDVDWAVLTDEAVKQQENGNPRAAEKFYLQAIAAAKKMSDENPQVAAATSNLANFYYVQGDGEQADRLFQESLAMRQKVLGKEHADVAIDLIGLARLYSKSGDYKKAEPMYAQAADILKKNNQPLPADLEKEWGAVKAKLKT